MRSLVIAVSLVALAAAPTGAATYNYRGDVLWNPTTPGTIVNRLAIDFDGQLFGQQLVLMLDSGSIYQDALGGETPPNSAFFPIAPSLEYDTFVAMGGYTPQTSEDILVVGGSTELGFNTGKQFDTQGINVAWAPAPGVVIEGRTNFPVFQITLTDDAAGFWLFYSNSGGVPRFFDGGDIVGGVMLYPPEPGSALIAAMALVGAAVGRRRFL